LTYSIVIAFWARGQIHKGLQETLAIRLYSVNKQTTYVIGYATFWSVYFLICFITFVPNRSLSSNQTKNLRTTSIFILASRGLFTLTFFLIANRKEITGYFLDKHRHASNTSDSPSEYSYAPKVENENIQLNVALQHEIQRFTKLGIQKAIKDADMDGEVSESLSTTVPRSSNMFYKDNNPVGRSLICMLPLIGMSSIAD